MAAEEPDPTKAMEIKRSCRDLPFLLAFVAFWVGMIACAGVGFSEGDPRVLVFGHDYAGNLCDEGYTSGFKYRYWVNFKELMYVAKDALDASASTLASGSTNYAGLSIRDTTSICLKECPTVGDGEELKWVCSYPEGASNYTSSPLTMTMEEWAAMEYDYFNKLTNEYKKTSYQFKGPCWPVMFYTAGEYYSCQFGKVNGSYASVETTELFKDKCQDKLGLADPNCYVDASMLTDTIDAIIEAIEDLLNSFSAIFDRYIEDIGAAWRVMLVAGAVIPLIGGVFWLVVLRLFADVFAWIAVILVNLVFWLLAIFFSVKAGWIGDNELSSVTGESDVDIPEEAPEENIRAMKGFAVFFYICAVLLLIITIIMAKRIKIATACLKVATQAIAHAPTVMVFPMLPFLMIVSLLVYWFFAGLYLFSSGDTKPREACYTEDKWDTIQQFCHTPDDRGTCNCGYGLEFDKGLQYMLLYHLFGLLWTSQWIIGFGMVVTAMVISEFYWSRGEGGKLIDAPVIRAMKNTFLYHTGSIAFGAFLVAVVQFIRLIVKYMESKCKELKEKNPAMKFVFCIVNYCLWYLQKIIEFINRNAYIMIAVEGKGYCSSAMRAMKLILNNILRVAAVNTIGDMILFLGKLSIAGLSGVIAYSMLDAERYQTGADKVSSPLLVVFFCILTGWIIASIFMAIVEMAIDTVLLAFCLDCEKHNGTPQYAPELLMNAMGMADKFNKDKAERKAAKAQAKASAATQAASAI